MNDKKTNLNETYRKEGQESSAQGSQNQPKAVGPSDVNRAETVKSAGQGTSKAAGQSEGSQASKGAGQEDKTHSY